MEIQLRRSAVPADHVQFQPPALAGLRDHADVPHVFSFKFFHFGFLLSSDLGGRGRPPMYTGSKGDGRETVPCTSIGSLFSSLAGG